MMPTMEQWKVYCKYLCVWYSLKDTRIVQIARSLNEDNGVAEFPFEKVYDYTHEVKRYDLTRDKCLSFNEFMEDRKIVIDNGENWNKYGYAQRFRVDYPIDSFDYWKTRV